MNLKSPPSKSSKLLSTSGAAVCAVVCLLSHPSQAAEESPDALKQRVLALARMVTPEDYAFTRTARVEQTEGEKKEERVTVEQFDPRKAAEQRWTLISVDGHPPTADELKVHSKQAAGRRVPNYGRIAHYFNTASTASTDARGRTVYRFAALPKESLMVNDADLSANAVIDATVNASGAVPFVEETRSTLTKPMRLKLVAKVERLEARTKYRLMSDGKPVPVEQVSDTNGSMLGKTGRIKTTFTYADQRPARE